MKKLLFVFVLIGQMSQFLRAEEASLFDTRHMHNANFFENTVRREINGAEKFNFLSLLSICTIVINYVYPV